MDGTSLQSVGSIKDLGIILISKLTFLPHIDKVVIMAYRIVLYSVTTNILRTLRHKLSYTTICSENWSIIWHPHYATHMLRTERVQKHFVSNLTFGAGSAKRIRSYKMRLKKFTQVSPENYRDLLNLRFLDKLFNIESTTHNCQQWLNLIFPWYTLVMELFPFWCHHLQKQNWVSTHQSPVYLRLA